MGSMQRETGAKWAALPLPQPIHPKSDRLLAALVEQAIAGGARVVQYRGKDPDAARRRSQAASLLAPCRAGGVALIVNDDPGLAAEIGADGVHIGKDDASLAAAREILGPEAIIGVSCYADLDRAIRAEQAGASYVAFGSLYPSPTKPRATHAPLDLITEARGRLSVPLVAIGGITADNAAAVIAAGADMVAVISGVFAAAEVTAAARAYSRLFETGDRPQQESQP